MILGKAEIKEMSKGAPRRFFLYREEDVSGVSGIGPVAFGVCFTDGPCVLYWKGENASLNEYKNISNVIKVHGHEGRTKVIWID